jgi:signal transduction histidine kinase
MPDPRRRSRLTTGPRADVHAGCVRTRTRLEHLCDELTQRLSDQQRQRQEALSLLSHDLRNPLSVVLVTSRVLSRSLSADPRAVRQIEAIGRAAEEMNRMLQDLLDAQRLDGSGLDLALEPHDLGPLVDKIVNSAARAAEQKAVTIAKEIPAGLPRVLADRDRVLHVLANLVDSAVRFTHKSGHVAVAAKPSGDDVVVTVSDDGPGISDDARPLLFTRPTSRRTTSQGVGISAFVVKGIVESHGGRVWVESTPGSGAAFHFTLRQS